MTPTERQQIAEIVRQERNGNHKKWTVIIACVAILASCAGDGVKGAVDWATSALGVQSASIQIDTDAAREQGALLQRVTALEAHAEQWKQDHDMIVEMHSWMRDIKQRDAQGARQ